MTSREQSCMDNCARRFLESTQFVVSGRRCGVTL